LCQRWQRLLYSSYCSGRGGDDAVVEFMMNFSLSLSRYYSCVVVLALFILLHLL
jgi:hypothetical protein